MKAVNPRSIVLLTDGNEYPKRLGEEVKKNDVCNMATVSETMECKGH